MMRDLQKDLALCNAATRGPWVIKWDELETADGCILPCSDKDLEFIAAAREGWPEAIGRCLRSENFIKGLNIELAAERDRRAKAEAEVERLNKICESCPEFGNINFSVELARTKRALELAVDFGKPEDCGYCPLLENCDDTKCLEQLHDYFIKQAEKEG